MGKLKKVGSIEIDEDMDFQRASWKVQRAGWVLMLLFIITGLLGLFGNGPISSARAGDEGSTLLVEYDRFLRVHAPTAAMFRIGNDAALPDSTVRLWVDRSWVSAFELRAITPEPDRAETAGTRLVYVFRVVPPRRSYASRWISRRGKQAGSTERSVSRTVPQSAYRSSHIPDQEA